MSGKIILLIMKIILLKMKTILRIVVLEKGFPARAQEKMFVGRAVNFASKWSVENEPISGQDKPFISDGFEMQTIRSQPV